jgi:hypothetical protein
MDPKEIVSDIKTKGLNEFIFIILYGFTCKSIHILHFEKTLDKLIKFIISIIFQIFYL